MTDFSEFTMPLADAMTTQRAVRRIKPDPVDDALVLKLIELAMKAPTAQDGQGFEFVVVKDRAVKAKIARLARIMWRLYGSAAARKAAKDERFRRMYKAVTWSVDNFEEIPVYIVPCYRGLPGYPPVLAASSYGSILPAVQNLLLAARAAGLGATLTTLPMWSTFLLRRVLGLPRGVRPAAVIPIGWPIGKYGPTRRRPVGEVVSVDRWDNRPFSRAGHEMA